MTEQILSYADRLRMIYPVSHASIKLGPDKILLQFKMSGKEIGNPLVIFFDEGGRRVCFVREGKCFKLAENEKVSQAISSHYMASCVEFLKGDKDERS